MNRKIKPFEIIFILAISVVAAYYTTEALKGWGFFDPRDIQRYEPSGQYFKFDGDKTSTGFGYYDRKKERGR